MVRPIFDSLARGLARGSLFFKDLRAFGGVSGENVVPEHAGCFADFSVFLLTCAYLRVPFVVT